MRPLVRSGMCWRSTRTAAWPDAGALHRIGNAILEVAMELAVKPPRRLMAPCERSSRAGPPPDQCLHDCRAWWASI